MTSSDDLQLSASELIALAIQTGKNEGVTEATEVSYRQGRIDGLETALAIFRAAVEGIENKLAEVRLSQAPIVKETEPQDSPLEISVKDPNNGFAPRTRGLLEAANIETLGDLVVLDEKFLRQQVGLREVSLERIRAALARHGLFLAGEGPSEEQ